MVKLMNPDLVTPTDLIIGKLKSKIQSLQDELQKFKEYDEERKAYYKDALQRLGELESLVDEQDPAGKLRRRVKAQKGQIDTLQKLWKIARTSPEIPKDFDKAAAITENADLKALNKKLSQKNRQLTKDNLRLQKENIYLQYRYESIKSKCGNQTSDGK